MRVFILLALLVASPVYAADKALIINDQEQKELINALDVATRAQGLNIAASTVRLLYKLQNAGTVTAQKELKPDPKPEPKPAEKPAEEGPPQ